MKEHFVFILICVNSQLFYMLSVSQVYGENDF